MQPPPSPDRTAPRNGSSPRSSPLLHPPIKQPRAAGAPPEATSSVPQSSSPAQRQLPQKQPPPSLNQAAPRSGSFPRKSLLRPSIKQPPTPYLNQAAPRSGSSPRKSLPRPSIKQPSAAAAPPEAASSVPQLSSPAQRELPQKEPTPSLNRAAPRSGGSPRSSPLLHPPIKQPRAAAAPPEAASSVPQSSSPAQRELPQKEPPPSLNQAAPYSVPQSSSPAQQEIPQKEPTPSPNQAAPRSGSSPRSSLLRPSIKQPRAAGAPPERAYSVPQSSSPAQRQLPQKQPSPSLNQAAPRSGSSPEAVPYSVPQSSSPAQRQLLQKAVPYSVPQSSSPAQRQLPQKEPSVTIAVSLAQP